jgi:putative tricarboxylic transport membrane protein
MMAGIYYGAMYGGSTTSILVNIPGEAASVVTCLDGHEMAKRGRAGPALGISALGSFIAGTFAIILLMLVAPRLAEVAIAFGPAEYFSLMVLGLVMLTFLTQGSMAKALFMACLGVVLGLIGLDSINAQPRLTFGSIHLIDGIGIVPLVMGLFGVAEVLFNTEQSLKREIVSTKINNLLPSLDDWKRSWAPIARGSILGFFLGVLPGGGAVVASFGSYAIEKRFSKNPEEFGKGAIEGVAGPEAANNAAAGGAFIPLMTLGIPPNVVMALLLGAFIIHGLQPGPLMIVQNPKLFWGIIASMYIGNIMLLVLNLPLIGIWVKLLKLPYNVLFPLILLFTIIGVYASGNNVFDIYVMILFGIVGYFMRKFGFEPAPLVLAFVLGPLLENNLRKALILSQGDLVTFIQRPISGICLALAVLMLLSPLLPTLRKKREIVALDSEAS